MSDIKLSEDQQKARDAVVAHLRGETGPLLTVGGYAGTGKSTVLAEAVRAAGMYGPLAFCAPSQKAADVMKKKLIRVNAFRVGIDHCGTVHSVAYDLRDARQKWSKKAEESADAAKQAHELAQLGDVARDDGARRPIEGRVEQELEFEEKANKGRYSAIVLDEASMVNEDMFDRLSGFGIPMVAFGDHGQLPPVKSEFNLMQSPMIRLEKIHRQAAESPIVLVAQIAREEGRIPVKEWSPEVRKVRAGSDLSWSKALDKSWVMLCGRNQTRAFWNDRLRACYGFKSPEVEIGESVICLKNNRQMRLSNGLICTVKSVVPWGDERGKHWYRVTLDIGNAELYSGDILRHQFGSQSTLYSYPPASLLQDEVGDLFDWAWCMTVHKFQGSEADSVCVLEERMGGSEDMWRRFLYTAVTRAKRQLLVVGS